MDLTVVSVLLTIFLIFVFGTLAHMRKKFLEVAVLLAISLPALGIKFWSWNIPGVRFMS